MEEITLPDSVTFIGNSAFSGCTSLKEITLPNSITSIGYCAFYGCTSLEEITLPDSIASIGDCAFSGCTYLKEINIPDSITSIGDCAFYNTGIQHIHFSEAIANNDTLFEQLTQSSPMTREILLRIPTKR